MKILFSIRKGWFVYTPIIAFAFLGFLFLNKNALVKIRFAVLLFILVNIFLISHVPIWWNAGSFGQRFMVQSYAILAIPLGTFVKFISEKKLFAKLIVGTALFFMLSMNLFQTWQFVHWIIPGDGMTWAYYKYAFFKTSYMTSKEQKLLQLQRSYDPNEKFDDNDPDYQKHSIFFDGMETYDKPDTSVVSSAVFHEGKHAYKLSKKSEYSPSLKIPFNQVTPKDHAWIKLTVWFYPLNEMKQSTTDIVIHMKHDGTVYKYWANHLGDLPYKINEWNCHIAYYLTPVLQDEEDELYAYVWFKGETPLFIDDLQIEAFVRK